MNKIFSYFEENNLNNLKIDKKLEKATLEFYFLLYQKLKMKIDKKKGREISIDEIAKELKVDKEDIVIAIESGNAIQSLDENVNKENTGEKDLSLIDKISNEKNEEEIITNKLVVKQLMSELNTRDREVILLRFFREKTQSEVASILGISQVQVSRIEKKILGEMKNKLTSA